MSHRPVETQPVHHVASRALSADENSDLEATMRLSTAISCRAR